jgi:Protein of unknown function (DUF2274)
MIGSSLVVLSAEMGAMAVVGKSLADISVAMATLKLRSIADDEPVRPTIEISAHVRRDLVADAQVLARETS